MTAAASRAMAPASENFQRNAQRASRLVKSLSNERRLQIVCHLVDCEMSVGQLKDRLGFSQSSLSRHLARLRRDGLVDSRRQAQTIYYSLCSKQAIVLIEVLHDLFCKLDQPKANSRFPLFQRVEGGETGYSI